MKINNRGFAISTLLYGLLTLGVMLIMFIFQIMLTSHNNSNDLSKYIQGELEKTRAFRVSYNNGDLDNNEYQKKIACYRAWQGSKEANKDAVYDNCIK